MLSPENQAKVKAALHKRMTEVYGENYATSNNAIKDKVKPKRTNKVGRVVTTGNKPNKVFTDSCGDRHLRIPVVINVDIYLDDHEKDLTLIEIKDRIDQLDSMEMASLVFEAIKYNNVIKK